MQSITLLFNSSKEAENAFIDYFSESDSYLATLNRKAASITIEGTGLHIDIPDGLIAIVI